MKQAAKEFASRKSKHGRSAMFLPAQTCAVKEKLLASPRNRRNNQHLIPFFEAVLLIPQEADVFFIHIEVDEAPNLPVFSALRCWRSAGNRPSISVTSSGRLAAVLEISRTLLVCF